MTDHPDMDDAGIDASRERVMRAVAARIASAPAPIRVSAGVPRWRARARLVGAAVLIAVFVSGFTAGTVAWDRIHPLAIDVNVRMSTTLPSELRRLQLTPQQTDSLRSILRRGQDRMRAVISALEPRLRATADSVDAEVLQALSPDQRAKLQASRRLKRNEQIVIDTVRR